MRDRMIFYNRASSKRPAACWQAAVVIAFDPHRGKLLSVRGIHIADLARWIDERREAAAKELRQMTN